MSGNHRSSRHPERGPYVWTKTADQILISIVGNYCTKLMTQGTSAFAFSSETAPNAEATPPPRRLHDKC